MRRRLVNPACPINWAHPLNQGLVSEWAVIPNSGWRGGATFRDLVRGGKKFDDGTLTNGPTWKGGRGRRGGYGSLSFASASSQYVALSGASAATDYWTVAAWINTTSFANSPCILTTSGGTTFQLQSEGRLRVFPIVTGDSFTAVTTDTWWHVAATHVPGETRWFFNGVFDVNNATDSGTWPAGNSNIGSYTGSNYWDGLLDGIMFYNRTLRDVQVQALYQETRRGNPERWNWIRSLPAIVIPEEVVAGTPTTWKMRHGAAAGTVWKLSA